MEESVASKAKNTRARVDTKCAVVVSFVQKKVQKKTNFLYFESQKTEMR